MLAVALLDVRSAKKGDDEFMHQEDKQKHPWNPKLSKRKTLSIPLRWANGEQDAGFAYL